MYQPNRRRLALILMMGVLSAAGLADEPKLPMLTGEEQKLAAEALRLNREGLQLYQQGKPAAAVYSMRQSLEIYQKLYPVQEYSDGHPRIATSLNNLGFVLNATGQEEAALGCCEQGLQMYRKLYPAGKFPDGHADLATSLGHLGYVLEAMGQPEAAVGYHKQSLEMRQRLYPAGKFPNGHPHLAVSLSDLGAVLQAMGQAEAAVGFSKQGLEMQQRLLRWELATASEEAAFDKLDAQPWFLDAYLSATHTASAAADTTMEVIWPSRSMITRLLEPRQANVRAVGTEVGAKLDRLRGLRRRLEQLLHDTRMKPADRDKLLAAVGGAADRQGSLAPRRLRCGAGAARHVSARSTEVPTRAYRR